MTKLIPIIIIAFHLFSGPVIAKRTYGIVEVSKVRSVYDGDTIRVDIDYLHPIIGDNVPIRLNGIDTPEMNDKRYKIKLKAIEAKNFLIKKIKGGNNIELRNIERGKYFRMVGDLYVDGVDVGELMIEKGLAKPYDGGTKDRW